MPGQFPGLQADCYTITNLPKVALQVSSHPSTGGEVPSCDSKLLKIDALVDQHQLGRLSEKEISERTSKNLISLGNNLSPSTVYQHVTGRSIEICDGSGKTLEMFVPDNGEGEPISGWQITGTIKNNYLEPYKPSLEELDNMREIYGKLPSRGGGPTPAYGHKMTFSNFDRESTFSNGLTQVNTAKPRHSLLIPVNPSGTSTAQSAGAAHIIKLPRVMYLRGGTEGTMYGKVSSYVGEPSKNSKDD